MTPNDFRTDFPEFADTAQYPDASVSFWLTVAVQLVNAERWGPLTDLGQALVTAHHLVIGAHDRQAVAIGGVPGKMSGPQSSKTVDKVSGSYDTGAATLDNGGIWNLTSYGVRYLTLARSMGAGPMQF